VSWGVERPVSVEQTDAVDILGIDRETGHVVLTISDHLDWSDSAGHQTILQKKLNTYLAFVESGEILEQYPSAKNRPVAFRVVFQVPPDESGRAFVARAREVIESAGFTLRDEVHTVGRSTKLTRHCELQAGLFGGPTDRTLAGYFGPTVHLSWSGQRPSSLVSRPIIQRYRESLPLLQLYLLQPFLVSSNPSNKRPALAPASVSIRCGWPFSTV